MPTPDPRLVTALDIGSSKVSALIARRDPDIGNGAPGGGSLTVLGTGQRESRGVKRGYIADMDGTEAAVREAVAQAERIAGLNVEEAWVSFSAGGLVSDVANVEVEIGGHRIGQGDVDDLLEAGRGSIDDEGRMVLHAQPALYTLDGLNGVKNPLGLHAQKLGVDIHIIAADPAPVRNIDLTVRSAHLGVRAIVAAPVAAGLSTLSDEERELGVALVDLGADVTNVSLFAGGMLVGLASIGTGARDVTDDIASAFGTRRTQAERLKCFHGSALATPRDNHEMVEIAPMSDEDGAAGGRITRAQLIAVIRQRLEALTLEVDGALKSLGYTGPVGRQVVLCGGGAELRGIADFMQGVMGRAVRVGRPRGIGGLPDAHSGPAFSTLCGLALFAATDHADVRRVGMTAEPSAKAAGGGMVGRLIAAIRGSY